MFFDGARTDAANVVGAPGDGWRVAKATLALERGAAMLGLQVGFRRELEILLAVARRTGAAADPLLRDKLARAWIGLEAVRAYALDTLDGRNDRRRGLRPEDPVVPLAPGPRRAGHGGPRRAVHGFGKTTSTNGSACSCSAGRRRSTAGRMRSSATSSPTRALGLPRDDPTNERPPPARRQGRRDHRGGRHRHRRRRRPALPGGRRPGGDQRPARQAAGRHPRGTRRRATATGSGPSPATSPRRRRPPR